MAKQNKRRFPVFILLGVPNILASLACIIGGLFYIIFAVSFSSHIINYPLSNLLLELSLLIIFTVTNFFLAVKLINIHKIKFGILSVFIIAVTAFFLYVVSEFIILFPYPKDTAFAQSCVNFNGKNLSLNSIQSLNGWCYDSDALFYTFHSHRCTDYDISQFQLLFNTCNKYSSTDSKSCIANLQKQSNTLLDLGNSVNIPTIDIGEFENRWWGGYFCRINESSNGLTTKIYYHGIE